MKGESEPEHRPASQLSPDELASRLSGLAGYYLRGEQLEAAERYLDLARKLRPGGFRQLIASGRLAILRGEAETAIDCLSRARALDPFDEEVCDLLGELQHSLGNWGAALEVWADAQVLSGGIDPEQQSLYNDRLSAILAEMGIGSDDAREQLIEERARRFSELAKEALAAAGAEDTEKALGEASDETDSAEVLRTVHLFQGLGDADLELLEGAISYLGLSDGEVIFNEGQPSEDIYVIERGGVRIQRETPFGVQHLSTVRAGSVFGEMNFIDGRSRSADAVAEGPTKLLRVSHGALREVFEAEPDLALAFLREFWRGLADKVREANELMKSFFDDAVKTDTGEDGETKAEDKAEADAENDAEESGEQAALDADEKADVLKEQGMSGEDLRGIAEFAEARSYEVEKPIFLEGQPGEALFIVVSGQVLISKDIPGVGEEALAVLERGDFFGEMALVDGSPRSASAKAHASDTKVMRIGKSELDDLIERGGVAAFHLLSILCRLLSGRLREINDKIIQWRMMSGGF
jgi:CRP/FNR family cyclic AMP-dependent transcriptional regulator